MKNANKTLLATSHVHHCAPFCSKLTPPQISFYYNNYTRGTMWWASNHLTVVVPNPYIPWAYLYYFHNDVLQSVPSSFNPLTTWTARTAIPTPFTGVALKGVFWIRTMSPWTPARGEEYVRRGWRVGGTQLSSTCRNYYCIVLCHIANNGWRGRGTCVINDDDMLLTFVSPPKLPQLCT